MSKVFLSSLGRQDILPSNRIYKWQKKRDIYKANTNTYFKSLVVFSWSTSYFTQQQDLQMPKNREISIKQIQIHMSKALLSSLGREDISSSTGQIQALSGRLSLICLHLKSDLQIQIQWQKKIHKTKVPNTASGCLPLMNLSSHRETTKHAKRSAASFRQKGFGGKSHHKHWATH